MIFSSKIKELYKKTLFTRHDANGTIFYFSHTDFEGLGKVPFTFENQKGELLSGGIYSYEGYIEDKLVIFDHGMGTGHNAYMREIEMLARHGYRVLAYDHTGCTLSGGSHIRGLSGSLADLDACIRAVKSDSELGSLDLYVVGHSWGGFSTMNIPAYHSDIKAIVALSGFISVRDMHKQVLPGILSLWRNDVFEVEREENPDYADASAIDTLRSVPTRALIIHSDDDKTCSHKLHFSKLKGALEGAENVTFLSVTGKNHNPNYTSYAVREMTKFFADRTKRLKSGALTTDEQKRQFLSSYDWHKITEQDEILWQKIYDHLDR